MSAEPAYHRFSATAPADFLAELTAEIPADRFSAWVYEAMREKRWRDDLKALAGSLTDRPAPTGEGAGGATSLVR